jgi:hypothetical protein
MVRDGQFNEAFISHPAVAAAYKLAPELVVGGSKPSLQAVAEFALVQ